MSVFYAATHAEARMCFAAAIAVVGGGNSAGQAAVFLADRCRAVHLLVRRDTLAATMSRYLIDQLERHPSVIIHTGTEVRGLDGDGRLRGIDVRSGDGSTDRIDVSALFVLIGADSCTAWLRGHLAEEHGFLLTGDDVPPSALEPGHKPLPLETSRRGVFCTGDGRARSTKRVAVAAGEGAMAIKMVHERLRDAAPGLTAAIRRVG
jgi:thioredoxin reductase (NADPH)